MKIINILDDVVEILWIDDNEIEFLDIEEFKAKYGEEKIYNWYSTHIYI